MLSFLLFAGIGVIDFENYYPVYSMNKPEYKQASKNWVKENHPDWNDAKIAHEAERSFDESAQRLFEVSYNLRISDSRHKLQS